ncbi:MAG: SAM-dependent methyltransferase [Promethearchaeota archaeon]
MVNNSKEHRKDPHYKSAKREGYRARSAYKLIDIQKRFKVFKRAFYILDLGCAPGSWLQVAQEYAIENLNKYNDQYYHRDHYKIMGIDLKRTTPIENIKIIQEDFTKPEILHDLNTFFQDKLDLILSDASINKIGNKFTDQLRQIKLSFKILDLTKKLLKNKGNLVLKVFQGPDLKNFFKSLKYEFRIIKSFKPESSKKTSNEIYLIGLEKK